MFLYEILPSDSKAKDKVCVVMELRAPQRIKESNTAISAQQGCKEGIRASFQNELTGQHGMEKLLEP